jgi:hypothetical protein
MQMTIRLLLAMMISVCTGFGAESACLGKIASITSQTPILYNPFSPTDSQTKITLKVQNTGNQQCTYQLFIPTAYYPLRFGGKLDFSLAPSSNTASAASSPNQFSVSAGPLQPGQSASLAATLDIPRGQHALSGVLSTTISFTLAQAASAGSPPPLDQLLLTLNCIIPAIFEINVGGSGRRATIDFGEFTPKDTRHIVLQTRSTGHYQLQFSSGNKGYLVREGGAAGEKSRVPYALSINGQQVNPSGDSFLQFNTESRETSHKIAVAIGDSSNKMAGTYKDVITIRIASPL